MSRLPAPASPFVLAVLTAVVTLVGCQAGASPSAPAASATASVTPAPTVTASADATPALTDLSTGAPSASVPGQTATEWGPIWDALPPDFPVPDQAAPVEPDEAVSGAFDLQQTPADIATLLQSALESERLSTESMSGPLEDGSFVIESVDPVSGCRVQTVAAPLGSLTRLTFRYGADCPFPMEP